ncbi:MAG: hypothetical protein E5V59_16465 [Mesorhizobium sp.]|nr:MAG: hypothetical protein E5V59_16465 [Mesorhizobium sp.]
MAVSGAGDYRVDAEERRKLDEMLTEFDDYARCAKDHDELNRFMAHRNVLRQAGQSSEVTCDALQTFSHYETYKHSR